MTESTTPLERAQYVAHLMGGNGLSQNQQVELIAAELEKWSRADCAELGNAMTHLRHCAQCGQDDWSACDRGGQEAEAAWLKWQGDESSSSRPL